MPTPDDNDLTDVLAEARPADPAGLALARARVASALFGQAATLDRFHVLERLGKGGMGVVYAAYDPELDRKVALKMVSVPAGGREVALAEAKALAKLSHPNVVPVFDVGLVDEHVYIVMELVRGKTLRDWVKEKRAKDIVDAYRQAAMALAAAHAEKLVHRDFKPDNAIVGDDGRVRVVDFGLACEAQGQAVDDPRRIGGTPKYMSPERAITPATDQYAFSVSLAEAFDDEPPAWIAAIVERGRSTLPSERYPAMADVVHALGRDPARIWRNRAIAIGTAGVAVAAFVVGQSRAASTEVDVCSGGDAELEPAWPSAVRTSSLQRIAALSDYGRELAPRVDQAVSAFRDAWVSGYRNACMVRRADVQSASMFDRRMSCLGRGKSALETVAEITGGASKSNIGDVARALAALPDVKRCSDVVALSADVEPPSASLEPALAPLRADLEHARVQLAAGRAADAHTIAERTTRALRGLGYLPLVAEGLLVDGRSLMSGHAEDAIAVLRDATSTAFTANVDAIAVEAWARRAWLEGMRDREDALAGLDVILPVAGRTRSAFARALLLNNLGSVQIERGKFADARASLTQALAIARDVTGQNAVELVGVQQNLARVTDDLDQRAALQAGAVRDLARLLGDAHPDVLIFQMIYAASGVAVSRDARAILDSTCPKMTSHDRLSPLLRACFAELAFIADDLDDRAAALTAIDRAQDAPSSEQSGAPEIAGMHALLHGNPSAALAAFTTALADDPIEPGQNAYRNLGHARLRLGESQALLALGKPDQARASLAIAERLFAAEEATATTSVRRRLARVRAELAVLTATRDDREPARRYADAALAWYRRAGTAPARLAELDKIASTKASR